MPVDSTYMHVDTGWPCVPEVYILMYGMMCCNGVCELLSPFVRMLPPFLLLPSVLSSIQIRASAVQGFCVSSRGA